MLKLNELKEKHFYAVKINNRNRGFAKEEEYYAIAQLTRIDYCDTCEYDVLHFKHNKRTYLRKDYTKSGGEKEYITYLNDVIEIIEEQTGNPKQFIYHNSRIRLCNLEKDEEGNYENYYFPDNYHPGRH